MNIKTISWIFVLLLSWIQIVAAPINVSKIEPPNWWVGMKWDTLQLMVYGDNLNVTDVRSAQPQLNVLSWQSAADGKYLFIDIEIEDGTPPENYQFYFSNGLLKDTLNYSLMKRDDPAGRYSGFGPEDIVYLITPDRFVNGDPDNDNIAGMRDGLNRQDIIGRHGGDIAGIIQKLPYLKDLGVTAIWINPLLENDMDISYHGYAATDLYKIDPRFGTNELYRTLVTEAHNYGLKVIMDHVSNHIGIHHDWLTLLPEADWLNGDAQNHLFARHTKQVLFDIYSDSIQLKYLRNGWFADSMPDLNQFNEQVSTYLIQNSLWWIEYSGIDGIREDTYPYADPDYLARWIATIGAEYPDFTIVGEVWVHDPVFLAPFQIGNKMPVTTPATVASVTDFGLLEAFSQVFYHNNGIWPLYGFLSRDFLYSDPNQMLTFLDNHDILRFMDVVKGDTERYLMGLSLLMTLRGIPQIYYGAEIGLKGGGLDHGLIRAEFPGGFPGDTNDKFVKSGRTATESMIFNHLQRLISIRKEHIEFSHGKTLHFPPKDNVYIFFRIFESHKSLIIVNGSHQSRQANLEDQRQYLEGSADLQNMLTGETRKGIGETIPIPPHGVKIFKVFH
jgi:glycosidase